MASAGVKGVLNVRMHSRLQQHTKSQLTQNVTSVVDDHVKEPWSEVYYGESGVARDKRYREDTEPAEEERKAQNLSSSDSVVGRKLLKIARQNVWSEEQRSDHTSSRITPEKCTVNFIMFVSENLRKAREASLETTFSSGIHTARWDWQWCIFQENSAFLSLITEVMRITRIVWNADSQVQHYFCYATRSCPAGSFLLSAFNMNAASVATSTRQ